MSEVKLEPTAEEIERVKNALLDNIGEAYDVKARAAILAMDRRASPPAEPAAWQWRWRHPETSQDWSHWADGRSPLNGSNGYESEERALYASPPAPAVAVPEFLSIATHKLAALQADGWHVNGYALIKDDRRGFIDHGGFVGWWLPEHYPQHHLAAAPQPPATRSEEPAAWSCADLITGEESVILDGVHAQRRQASGNWTVSPLCRQPPATRSYEEGIDHWKRQAEAAGKNAALFQQDCAGHVKEKQALRAALAPFSAYAKRELDKNIPRHIQDDDSTPVLGSGLEYNDADAVIITVRDLKIAAAIRSLADEPRHGE